MKLTARFILISLGLIFVSCHQDETELTPSFKDIDRVATQVDVSKPLVKYYYDNYQIGILTQFQDTLDFMFTASNKTEAKKWERVYLPKLDATEVDSALSFLDTTFFKYFKKGIVLDGKTYNSDLFMQYMPKKILLCKGLYNENENLSALLTESDARVSTNALGALHCLGNIHSFVFNTDVDLLVQSKSKQIEFKKDNFYIFISYVLTQNNLYDLIPSEFYGSSVKYIGKLMSDAYVSDGMKPDTLYNLIDKNWFYAKGFVDAKYFYNRPLGLSSFVWIKDSAQYNVKITNPIFQNYYFVSSKALYVRSFLNQLIYADETTLQAYPENILDKYRTLIETFSGWGIDIVSFNPALNVLYN